MTKGQDRVTVIREFSDRAEALVYRDWNAESLAKEENARIQGPIKVDGLWRVTIKRILKGGDDACT